MAGRVRYNPRIDYYAVLDLPLSASADQIQSAFRKRAKRLHPDRNPDAEATHQFQRLSEAYSVLSDPVMRTEYDEARASINLRAAFQSLKRERAKTRRTARPSVGAAHWSNVLHGLTHSPYRYVFLLLALVVVANIGFAILTGSFNVNSPALSTVQPAATTVDGDGPPLPLNATSDPVNLACDPGAQMSSPRGYAIIGGAFEVKAPVSTDFQLEWAPATASNGRPATPDWKILSSGSGSTPTDVLASSALTAAAVTITRPAQILLRLTVGSPTNAQPVQVCEIIVTLKD